MDPTEIDRLLKNHDLPTNERQQLIKFIEKMTGQYESTLDMCRDDIRNNVLSYEQSTIKDIARTLQFRKKHPDPKIRHKASKLIRSLPHDTLATFNKRALSFLKRAAKTNDKRRQQDAHNLMITESLNAIEVRSLSLLRKVGKQLKLCFSSSRMAHYYLQRVQSGKEEFWVLCRDEAFIGILTVQRFKHPQEFSIDDNPAKALELTGVDHEKVDITHDEALKIIEILNIKQITTRTFHRFGAFPILRDASVKYPIPNPVSDGTQIHHIWYTRHNIVVASCPEDSASHDDWLNVSSTKWAAFTKNADGEWREFELFCEHFNLTTIFQLLINDPDFAKVFHNVRESRFDFPDGDEWDVFEF